MVPVKDQFPACFIRVQLSVGVHLRVGRKPVPALHARRRMVVFAGGHVLKIAIAICLSGGRVPMPADHLRRRVVVLDD